MNVPLSAVKLHPLERARGVRAVLGPTNTGKTHYATERMLGHRSGIIGLPLRLLAREVYNRVVERVGGAAVALITGEEKIKPKTARYFVSTVEAMPRDLDVAFVAIDEIQLAGDLDRGHIFTDRLLNRRGSEETLLVGASTMQRRIEELLPGTPILSRPRLSKLSFAGEQEDLAAAAAHGDRRFLGRGSLCDRRMDSPPARRGGGRSRCIVAAHPQRPSRDLPERRC